MRKAKMVALIIAAVGLVGCGEKIKTEEVWLTSESGAKCELQKNIVFTPITDCTQETAVVRIDVNEEKQVIDGYGASLTESSAFVLACLEEDERKAVLNELFSEQGANFPIVRTQIGASDFSVEGKYSLAEKEGDVELTSFSLDRDKEGFSKEVYPQVKNEAYDLYHLMKEVAGIKAAQADKEYRIIANTWTAPAWMKDNNAYYERDWSRNLHRGGALLKEYYQTYANYLVRYIQAWQEEGVQIWGITPVNEPMGNDGGWESMDFPAEVEAEFIAEYLGPTLEQNGLSDVKIFGFDQNIFEMGPYTAAIYGNETSNKYTTGMALHWYGSTFSCFPEVLDSIHALYPTKTLLHTEGCIDNLGCPAWDAVTDKEGFMESGWFDNDSFWWTASATDWAYSTPYWPELHPAYSACQRYAQYIIEGMNHWMTGYIDWNVVLDSIGGPNHVDNYAAAPIMIDYQNDKIYYTPYYYILKQFSKTMRPGDIALGVSETGDADLYVSAAKKQDGKVAIQILNKSAEEKTMKLQLKGYEAEVKAPANSVMTIVVNTTKA